MERIFAKEFSCFLEEVGVTKEASCLIVGLGNWNVTPDALGPIVVENVLVTRHLFQLRPESVEEGFRPVSAIRPGVMGLQESKRAMLFMELLRRRTRTL